MTFLRSRTATSLAALAASTMIVAPVLAQPGPPHPRSHPRHWHRGSGGNGLLAGLLVAGGAAAIVGAVSGSGASRQSAAVTQPPEDSETIDPADAEPVDPPAGEATREAPQGPSQSAASYPGAPEPGYSPDHDDRPPYPGDPDQSAVPDRPEADEAPAEQESEDTAPTAWNEDRRIDGNGDERRDDPHSDDGTGYGTAQDGERASGFDAAVDACSGELARSDKVIASVDGVRRMGERYSVEGTLKDGRAYACSVDGQGQIRSVAVDGHAVI